jgi:feruloyl-CoA synthase
MLFYAGASLPQDIWSDLEDMARAVRGDVPLFTSSWGMTETAPACLIQHERGSRSGTIGVPMTGLEIKLLPDTDEKGRYDLRVRGPNVTPGYLHDAEKTAALFDEEGFLVSGDAVRFVDETQPEKGMRFDGRMAEEFKLLTGTWVRAAGLRLELLGRLAPVVQDLVVCGADRSEIGLMLVPGAGARETAQDHDGLLVSAALADEIRKRIGDQTGQGSASRVARVVVLTEPPSMGAGEVTAKGNLNFAKLLKRRSGLLDRLYDDSDAAVIRI